MREFMNQIQYIYQILAFLGDHVNFLIIVFAFLGLVFCFFDIKFEHFEIHPVTQSELTPVRIGGVVFCILLLLFSFFVYPLLPTGIVPPLAKVTPTPSPKISSPVLSPTMPTPSLPKDAVSSLTPPNQNPNLDDSLQDSTQGHGWSVFSNATGSCGFINGQYVAMAPGGSTNGVICWLDDSSNVYTNFVYQAEMTILQGADDTNATAVGLVFRFNNSQGHYYSVTFDDQGDWSAGKDTGGFGDAGAICTNACQAFHSGENQSNYITIRASNDQIQIQINGQPLGTYTDDAYSSGSIGFLLDPGKNTSRVAFSHVRVWNV
jgi:hypothetical protein